MISIVSLRLLYLIFQHLFGLLLLLLGRTSATKDVELLVLRRWRRRRTGACRSRWR